MRRTSPAPGTRRRTSQRGFTLVELMIALLVSSLLVGLILAIFLRMSFAYRSQQQVAGVQQVLAAARGQLELDAKLAGTAMSDGIRFPDDMVYRPVRVVNSNAGPDMIGFAYADPAISATIVAVVPLLEKVEVDVDNIGTFAVNDVVVLSTPVVISNPVGPATEPMVTYLACALQIAVIAGNHVTFTTAPPWGKAGNTHCVDSTAPVATVPNLAPSAPPNTLPRVLPSRLYKLVARSYRIDPARPGEGVLQMAPSGEPLDPNVWRDLGYGFTDLQVATRFFVDLDAVDEDGDTDPSRDWFSGPDQQLRTSPGGVTSNIPIELTISLGARTEREVEGIASTTTPPLTGVPIDNNNLGDRDAIDLTTTVDPTLQGQRIYRYTTFRIDLRNIGGGR